MESKESRSANKEKARLKLAIAREKISNWKKDFIQKQTTQLIRFYDEIYVTQDQDSFIAASELMRILQYKANWYGKKVIFEE